MSKRTVIFLLSLIYASHTFAMAFEYKLNPAFEAAQLGKLNSFIKATGFTGKYYLSNDKRVFQRLEGTFNLPEVTDTMSFRNNCNQILQSVLGSYKSEGVEFKLELSSSGTDKTKDKNPLSYHARYTQTCGGLQLIVLSNYAAYTRFKYKRQLGVDSLMNKHDFHIRTYFNADSLMQYVSFKEGFADYGTSIKEGFTNYGSSIEISYDVTTKEYYLGNYLFPEPVIIPELKIDAEEAKKVITLSAEERFLTPYLKFYAFPLNHIRSEFEYKLLWVIETSSTHSGGIYYIDATTGKIFYSGCSWID